MCRMRPRAVRLEFTSKQWWWSRPPHRSIEKIIAGAIVRTTRSWSSVQVAEKERVFMEWAKLTGHDGPTNVLGISSGWCHDILVVAIDSILVPSIRFEFG